MLLSWARLIPFVILTYKRHYRLVRRYWKINHKLPNIFRPDSYHEKMLWRKIFDRDPQFVTFSDKLAAKYLVRDVLPSLHQAEVLWTGRSLEDAPPHLLDCHVFLKINNNSNRNLILPDPDLSWEDLNRVTHSWLKERHGRKYGQWTYAEVEPMLLIESDISAEMGGGLVDLRLYTMSGKIVLIVMETGKFSDPRSALFDPSGHRLDACSLHLETGEPLPNVPHDTPLPVETERLSEVAEAVARGQDFIRVDLMWNGEDLFFSELTVFPRGGNLILSDRSLVEAVGKAWDLRKSWFLTTPQAGWRGVYARLLRSHLDRRARV